MDSTKHQLGAILLELAQNLHLLASKKDVVPEINRCEPKAGKGGLGDSRRRVNHPGGGGREEEAMTVAGDRQGRETAVQGGMRGICIQGAKGADSHQRQQLRMAVQTGRPGNMYAPLVNEHEDQ